MRLSLVPLLLSAAATVVTASSKAVDESIDALNTIRSLTNNLTTVIKDWDGKNLTVALSIQAAGTDLVYKLNNETAELKDVSGTFSTTDAFDIGAPTQYLAYAVNASIAALIAKKPDFEALGIASIVVTSLKTQLSASNNFSAVLLAKVPSDVLPVATALNSQVVDSLNQGLDCFEGQNASCITAVANASRTETAAADSGAYKAPSAGQRSASAAGFTALALAVVAAAFML